MNITHDPFTDAYNLSDYTIKPLMVKLGGTNVIIKAYKLFDVALLVRSNVDCGLDISKLNNLLESTLETQYVVSTNLILGHCVDEDNPDGSHELYVVVSNDRYMLTDLKTLRQEHTVY